MRIDRRLASGGLCVIDEVHIHCDEFAVLEIGQMPTRVMRVIRNWGGGCGDCGDCVDCGDLEIRDRKH